MSLLRDNSERSCFTRTQETSLVLCVLRRCTSTVAHRWGREQRRVSRLRDQTYMQTTTGATTRVYFPVTAVCETNNNSLVQKITSR